MSEPHIRPAPDRHHRWSDGSLASGKYCTWQSDRGMSHEQIAARLGITQEESRRRLQQAHRSFKREWIRLFGEPPDDFQF